MATNIGKYCKCFKLKSEADGKKKIDLMIGKMFDNFQREFWDGWQYKWLTTKHYDSLQTFLSSTVH